MVSPGESNDFRHPRRWWPLWLWAAVVVVVGCWLWAAALRERDEAMAKATARIQSQAELAAAHVHHLMDSADTSIKVAARLFLRNPDWALLANDRDAWQTLNDLVSSRPGFPTLFLADASGRFRLHSLAFPTPAGTVADRNYFQQLRQTPTSRPLISEPVIGQLIGQPSLILSRRLDDLDGGFAGIAAANINPRAIADFFATIGLGEGGIINLQRSDGIILVRHPHREGAVGTKVDNSILFPEMTSETLKGDRITVSPLDQVTRLSAFHRIPDYGLLVLAAEPLEPVLTPWRAQTLRTMVVVGAGLAGLTLFLLILLRHRHDEALTLARLTAREADLQQAHEVAQLGYYVYDMRIDRWDSSPILDRILGIGPAYVRTAAGWLDLVAPSVRPHMGDYLREIVAGQHDFDHEYPIIRADDGAMRWVWGLGRLERDEDGRPVRLLGTIRDITDRKEAELALRAKAEELTRSNTELEQFAYVASHDLREPLRMIGAYVDLLDRRYGPRLDTEAREFIAFAKDGAKRMDRLVLDLLEYSRIGRVTRPMALVPLGRVLDRAIQPLRLKIEEAGATLILPDESLPEVWGDGEELARLFQNLVGNAIKYRAPDRAPEIRITAGLNPEGLLVSVADNGIGIDPQFFERIFLIFQRLHPAGAYEGTGIGLAISRKIVEHHRGRLWLDSVPGQGTRFHVLLPTHAP